MFDSRCSNLILVCQISHSRLVTHHHVSFTHVTNWLQPRLWIGTNPLSYQSKPINPPPTYVAPRTLSFQFLSAPPKHRALEYCTRRLAASLNTDILPSRRPVSHNSSYVASCHSSASTTQRTATTYFLVSYQPLGWLFVSYIYPGTFPLFWKSSRLAAH